MAQKSEKKTIDGIEVTVVKFKPSKGYRLNFLLLRTLGPTLSAIVPSIIAAASDKTLSRDERIAAAIQSVMHVDFTDFGAALARLHEDAMEVLLHKVLEGTSVIVEKEGDKEGVLKRVQFDLIHGQSAIDQVFEDHDQMTLFSVAWFALTVNYQTFTKRASAELKSRATARSQEATP